MIQPARSGDGRCQSSPLSDSIFYSRGRQARIFRAPRTFRSLVILFALIALASHLASAAVIWTEGENPTRTTVKRHPWWYDKVNRADFSGGDFISNWSDAPGEAEYAITAPKAGEYDFWVHANPVATTLGYQVNDAAPAEIDFSRHSQDQINVAADGKIDLRFIAWTHVGKVTLKQGANAIIFRFESKNHYHGMLDCFVLSNEAFEPHGIFKPGDDVAAAAVVAKDWFAFAPKPDAFAASSGFDLRSLNESQAGDEGFIAAAHARFIHQKTGKPVRFWAVNGPPADLNDPADLLACGRMLAKHGVNLVRIHGAYYDKDGAFDPKRIEHVQRVVAAMKSSGIYSHLSVYFPLWLAPRADHPTLKGYDGAKHPFATLYFDPDFQAQYRGWLQHILTTPDAGGKRIVDEPAVMGLELINEDSYFFWTFNDKNIPQPELQILEKQFGDWLIHRHGSLDAALAAWHGKTMPRDDAAEGRMGFRPLYAMFGERGPRDQETAEFLADSQRGFYQSMIQYVRDLGFKGMITCSNWATASPQYFGPIEKYTYSAGDFFDRHGYFDCDVHGPNDGWAIMNSQTYFDRSALRFDPPAPGKPRQFVHPAMDIHYDDKPSMISETTFCRPNRYRTEAVPYYAFYGALQGSDAIVHFALDGDHWTVKPGYFMQPWTLMTPTMMGQFPAAALIYRQGLIDEGQTMVDLNLKIADTLALHGTPMPQDASFDELRLKDVPTGSDLKASSIIDPLVHYVGRTSVKFTDAGGPAKLVDLSTYINHTAQTIESSTHQLKLDYRLGVLTVNAPAAQGLVGNLKDAGVVKTHDLTISSDLDLASVIAVSLDGKPLSSSAKILLQVMSEEQSSGFGATFAGNGLKRIADIGHDPWLVRKLSGEVRLTRPDSAKLTVTPLDFNGYPGAAIGAADAIKLQPEVVYYLITGSMTRD